MELALGLWPRADAQAVLQIAEVSCPSVNSAHQADSNAALCSPMIAWTMLQQTIIIILGAVPSFVMRPIGSQANEPKWSGCTRPGVRQQPFSDYNDRCGALESRCARCNAVYGKIQEGHQLPSSPLALYAQSGGRQQAVLVLRGRSDDQ